MKAAINLAIQNDKHDCAKMVYEKFGDEKHLISREAYTHIYFERYFSLAKHLESNKSTNKLKKSNTHLRSIKVYKTYLSDILKHKTQCSISELSGRKEDFECPVCFEDMVQPKKIFSCFNGHYICSVCVSDSRIKKCPICRDDFNLKKPKRCIEAEEKAKTFIGT